MIKKMILIAAGVIFPLIASAAQPIYQLDAKDGNWSAFHYQDAQSQKVTACFALSNDLALGFKSNNEEVGLVTWNKQGKLQPKTDTRFAITVGKQHFTFTMQAMDQNMSMNRLSDQDFKRLLQALSYGQIALLEYGKNPVSVVDLSGLPNVLAKFHQCIKNANFKDYK